MKIKQTAMTCSVLGFLGCVIFLLPPHGLVSVFIAGGFFGIALVFSVVRFKLSGIRIIHEAGNDRTPPA